MTTESTMGGNSQKQLQSYARRLGNLLDTRDEVAEDTKELMKEAKNDGFEPKVLREALKRMRADQAEREEFEAKVDLYTHAIQNDLFDDTAVTISAAGVSVETTVGGMKAAADRLAN